MPAKSKSQQRFFGMVDAYKKGELEHPSKAIKKAAKGMTKKQVKDFASTKQKGLPEKVEEGTINLDGLDINRIVKESIEKVLSEDYNQGNRLMQDNLLQTVRQIGKMATHYQSRPSIPTLTNLAFACKRLVEMYSAMSRQQK